MKKVFLLLTIVGSLYAITPFTYYWTISNSDDKANVTKWRANNDSVLFWSRRICDTMNKNMFRKKWLTDSLYDSINVKKLKHCDSIYTRVIKSTYFDSLFTPKGLKAARGEFGSWVRADSVYARIAVIPTVNTSTVNTTIVNSPNVIGTYIQCTSFVAKYGAIDTVSAVKINASKCNIDTVYATRLSSIDSVVGIYAKFKTIKITSDTLIKAAITYTGFSSGGIDSIYYRIAPIGTRNIVSLWFKGATGVGSDTSWGGTLPVSGIYPNDTQKVPVTLLNDTEKKTSGVCVISPNGQIHFNMHHLYTDHIAYNSDYNAGSGKSKGSAPFFVSYIK